MGTEKDKLNELLELIEGSKHIVAMTGAGVSTLSGIPDFRSDKTGFWKKYDPDLIFSLSRFKKEPHHFYNFAFDNIYSFLNKEPSVVHQVLAKMELNGKLSSVITQNIDLLHQKAGSVNVLELHGSLMDNHCMKCGRKFRIKEINKHIMAREIPLCVCGGIIKPDIIFFEEPLTEKVFERAQQEMIDADLLFILGSSMVVYPAALLPSVFIRSGGELIIVNKQPTGYDAKARIRIEDLEKTFSFLNENLFV